MAFPSTPVLLQWALAKKLRAMAAPDGAPWDNEDELEQAAKEVASDYDWAPLGPVRRPWMVVDQEKGPPTVVGHAVVRVHDLLHAPVKRGLAEERGIFWRPKQEQDKADHVAAAINALEEEAEGSD